MVIFKWFLVIIILIHGTIHIMGASNELGWAKISALSGKTLLTLTPPMNTILGILWLISFVILITAAIGLITNAQWWRFLAIIAAMLSQVLIVIWWPDAKWGTVANVLIIVGSIFLKK